ncbi:hypothetical protein [Alkalihalobacterium bogoriense]|uniref:hypothetical protein n=1 Tax=Alkalihalobacterium bogoriense TaxID=246272 RepID=UPI00047A850F|nr:hypothetical protein [Alkalihalobacterium bogoriense]
MKGNTIVLNNVNVMNLSNCSGVFIGSNVQHTFTTTSQTKTGLGTISGNNNFIVNNNSIVTD